MAFDRQGALKAGYSPQEIDAYLAKKAINQSHTESNPNVLQQVGNVFAPETTRTISTLPQKLAQKSASLPNAKGNLPQAFSNAATMTGELAKGTIGNPGIWAEGALNVGGGLLGKAGAIATGKGAKLLALLAKYPTLAKAGKGIENKAIQAGEVAPELMQKHLAPEKILKNTATAAPNEQNAVKTKFMEELKGLQPGLKGDSTGTLTEMPNSFSKILEYRKVAGQQAKYANKAGSPDTTYYKNLQRAYSNILKEGAGTKDLDKVYSLLSKTQGVKNNLVKQAKWVVPSAILYGLMNKIGSIGK